MMIKFYGFNNGKAIAVNNQKKYNEQVLDTIVKMAKNKKP